MSSFTGRLFEPGSVFNVPFGPNAQWASNAQLSSAGVNVNTNANLGGSSWNDTLYQAADSDPLVTVSGATNWEGQPYGDIQVHIPTGAEPASGTDKQMNVVSNGTLYSLYDFQWTGSNSATASYSAIESATGSGVQDLPSGQFDGSDYDFAVGQLDAADLTQAASTGVIDHMLRVSIPLDMAHSYSSTSTNVLAPNAGPQTMEDGFAINGDGAPPYSGTINYGVTIGIPAGVAEPADIKANAGANVLWNTLQQHGAMIRDTNGSSNQVDFYASQDVSPSSPMVQGMNQYGAEIMQYTKILANEGPNMVNGNPGANWVAGQSTGGNTGGGTGGDPKPSSSGTIITPGHGSFVAANGDTYTLTTADVAMQNGSAIAGGTGTSAMEYYQGQVYGEDANSHDWYKWDGTYWLSASAPPTSTPSSTVITPGHGSFADKAGNVYVLATNGNAMENGAAIAGGGGTVKMEFYNGLVYGEDSRTGDWYTWNQHEWISASAPPSTAAVMQSAISAADIAPRKPRQCCSGRCSPQGRSRCARSTVGKRSTRNSPLNALTWRLEPISHCTWRHRRTKFPQQSRRHPDLNPMETVWEYLRANRLCALVWDSYKAILKACSSAWNFFVNDPERIRSIGTREWACGIRQRETPSACEKRDF